MGGERERIRVLELGGVDVRVALNRFDAGRAKCFLVEDQEKLLAVIESGFGSLAPFNQLIRSVFRDARATHLESLVVASADGTRAATDRLEAKVDRLQATLDRLMSEGIQSVAVARTTADDVLSA